MLSESARKYIGVTFKCHGRSSSALDCAGLLVLSARDIGVNLVDSNLYSSSVRNGILLSTLEKSKNLARVDSKTPVKDDIIVFRFNSEPHHIAICCGDSMIHAMSKVGKVTEHRLSGAWKNKIECLYRIVSHG